MQLKFNKQPSIGQSFLKRIVQTVIASLIIIFVIFLLSKFNFPSPNKDIKKDISNEIIKLK